MKQIQGVFFSGYVTIKIVGDQPELFLNRCIKNGIAVWNVTKMRPGVCIGSIRLKDVSKLRSIRKYTDVKISFVQKKGLPFLSRRLFRKKPLISAMILSVFFVLFLSNMIWSVNVAGVHTEIENKIYEKLDEYGVRPGSMKFTIGSPSAIQQKLLDDIPELLWVGVTEKGTTYHLEGVEKTTVEEEEEAGPRNLIASKKGVVVDMFVSKGEPKVKVNDYVQAGDLLVSGQLGEEEKKEDEEDKEDKEDKEIISAEGEVIAQTWYQTELSIPMDGNYEVLTGDKKEKYFIKLGGFHLPFWGFTDPDYEYTQKEVNEKQLQFFKWKLPISIVNSTLFEKERIEEKRTKKDAIDTGIKQAKTDLQTEIGKDAEISFEKILHESIENGKVKLVLYFKVKEDITKPQPISQGD